MKVQSRIVTALCFLVSSLFPPSLLSQVYTLDYLTYSDHAFQSPMDFSKGRLTSYLYVPKGDFDESRTITGRPAKELHVVASPRIYNGRNVQMNFSFRNGFLIGPGFQTYLWGLPWIWGKVRLLQNPQLALRLGFEWAEFGASYWSNENKFDLGLLSSKKLYRLDLEAGLSYRAAQQNRSRPIR